MTRTVQDLIEQAKLRESLMKKSETNKKKLESNVRKALRKEKIDKVKERVNRRIKKGQKIEKGFSKLSGKAFKKVSSAYRPSARLSKSLLNIEAGFSGQRPQGQRVKARVKARPGRPRGDFEYRDPFTKKPIPATLYYKKMKQWKRLHQQISNLQDLQAIQQLARRGIPPEQAKQIVDQKQIQSVMNQQQFQGGVMPPQTSQRVIVQRQPQQMPKTYPSRAVRPIWRRRGVVREDWGLFGKKKIVTGLPQSFWN